jgi:hypothetical protein
MLVLLIERNYKVNVETGSGGMICLLSFMKFGVGVQAILRFVLSNWNGCNVGITDGRDVRNGLRWEDVRTKCHDDWFRHLNNLTVITATI